MSLWEYLQFPFIQYALIVGVLIAVCASLIGVPLVLKRFSVIGEGLSHVAFVGMAAASVINLANSLVVTMPLTVIVSVFLLCGRGGKVKGDASVAMISAGALALGYFIVNVFTNSGNVAADVCTSLFGSTAILTLSIADVWISVVMSIAAVAFFIIFYNKIFAITFDTEFSQAAGVKTKIYEILIAVIIGIVIALSMRLVGSLLTSALIIFPALSAMRLFKSFKSVVFAAGATAAACALLGLLISIIFGTPVGSTIVLANIFVFCLFCITGIILRTARKEV